MSNISINDNFEIKRRRIKRRGHSRYLLLFAAISIVLVIGVYIGSLQLKNMEYFTVNKIEVVGNVNLNSLFLEELSKEFIGMNLFSVNLDDLIFKYDNIARINSIKAKRDIPDKLVIVIKERIGYLYVKTVEGILFPIDFERIVLDNRGFYPNEDLPVYDSNLSSEQLVIGDNIIDDGLETIFSVNSIIKASNFNEKYISEYYFTGDDLNIVIDTSKNSTTICHVCLGNGNYQDKIEKLQFISDNVGIEHLTVLDFRFNDQVVIRGRKK